MNQVSTIFLHFIEQELSIGRDRISFHEAHLSTLNSDEVISRCKNVWCTKTEALVKAPKNEHILYLHFSAKLCVLINTADLMASFSILLIFTTFSP